MKVEHAGEIWDLWFQVPNIKVIHKKINIKIWDQMNHYFKAEAFSMRLRLWFFPVLKEKDKNKLLEAADDRHMTQDTLSAEPYNQLSTLTWNQ